MKHFIKLLLVFLSFNVYAQAPQGFNYQATVRNQEGQLITNQNVYFKFNLMQGSPTSVPVFTETHYVPTDDKGTVNLIIGQGTADTGTANFNEINWSLGNYHMGIELNTGNGYIALGTLQLMSVPYALYAEQTGAVPETPSLASVLDKNNSANNLQIKNLGDPTDDQDAVNKAYVTQLENEIKKINTILELSGDLNPSIEWQKTYPGLLPARMISDSNNDILITGQSNYKDLFVTKKDASGNEIWTKNFESGEGGNFYGIDIIEKSDLSGYFLLCYITNKTEDISTYYGGVSDVWIVELNYNGELVNEKTFGDITTDVGWRIVQSVNGYTVSGYTSINNEGEPNLYALWLFEIDDSLELISEIKNFSGINNPTDPQIAHIGNNEFILSAKYNNDNNRDDIWLARVNGNTGEIVWENTIGNQDNDGVNSLLINGDFVILSGYLETNKAFWAKYSLNGIPISTKVFSTSSVFNDVIQDNSGNFYFSGRVDPPGSDIDVIDHGQIDVLVIKTDAELNEIWQKSFGGSRDDVTSSGFRIPSIIINENNNLIITTSSYSSDGNVWSTDSSGKIWLFEIINE